MKIKNYLKPFLSESVPIIFFSRFRRPFSVLLFILSFFNLFLFAYFLFILRRFDFMLFGMSIASIVVYIYLLNKKKVNKETELIIIYFTEKFFTGFVALAVMIGAIFLFIDHNRNAYPYLVLSLLLLPIIEYIPLFRKYYIALFIIKIVIILIIILGFLNF